jgi:hypothetical protein
LPIVRSVFNWNSETQSDICRAARYRHSEWPGLYLYLFKQREFTTARF